MKKLVLQSLRFGERVAEEEKDLPAYFVPTSYWHEIIKGDKDIIYGAKGSGKSAIFRVLLNTKTKLFNNNRIVVIPAEKIDGDPVFQRFKNHLPETEAGFQLLWKLYFLGLIGEAIADRKRRYVLPGKTSRKFLNDLEKYELTQEGKPSALGDSLRKAIEIVSNLEPESINAGSIEIEPSTQAMTYTLPGITFRKKDNKNKLPPVDELLAAANKTLAELDLTAWLIIDRLDVAFDESEEMERNAILALFRVYTSFRDAYDRVALKIFLRDDIWARVTKYGYREATRIVRDTRISWTPELLFNLVIRRLLHNRAVREFYGVGASEVLADHERQRQLFSQVFPAIINDGGEVYDSFEWMLSSIRDGLGNKTPRELVHLLSSARDAQLRRINLGIKEPSGENLFDDEALKQALYDVSKERLDKHLYAEHSHLRTLIQALERHRPRQSAKMLAKKWGVSVEEAVNRAKALVEVGAFEEIGTPDNPVFIVPKLFRPALNIQEQKRASVSHSTPTELVAPASSEEVTSSGPKVVKPIILPTSPHQEEQVKATDSQSDVNEEEFYRICASFDDPNEGVRNNAIRALYDLTEDRAETFTRALREAPPERRFKIGKAIANSGLAQESIDQLTGESRDRTYDAFTILFFMAKAGETSPLIRAIESHPDNEVRLAVVKLLALSGQQEVLPSFRRLAVRGSLPQDVRAAVMEAIYQIASGGGTANIPKKPEGK